MMSMRNLFFLATAVGCLAFPFGTRAIAGPVNEAPPTGNIIYQLTGQPISSSYTHVSGVSFVATATTTNLSFAFREDPAFLELDNVSLTTGGGSNLLTNGDFEAGPLGAAAPTGWTYLNIFGATFGGNVVSGCGTGGSNCYYDGAVQAYDAITQAVSTVIGQTYDLEFDFADTSAGGVYQPLSTNGNITGTGGNGRDMFVYAGALPTRAAPEPATLAILGLGLAGLGLMRRRRAH